ncbi:MAG: hypothetical protein K2N28_02200, partial [Muribaculaceae bacterium]|nr:hypothetical protein [Muribaculaceae bacterium]
SVKAKISDKNSATGTLTVTTGPTVDEYDKVVLLATNGHATTMSSISFEEAGLRINSDVTYDIPADAQTIDINIETNASYTVSIPEEAQDWISHTAPSRAWRSETITLKIEANESDARTATVTLLDEDGKPLGSIVIKQDSDFPDPFTAFPDEVFRNYVLRNFDTNKDGRISSEEALNVTKIYIGVSDKLESLDGIEYFPNLTSLECFCLYKLTSLDVSKNTKLTELLCYENRQLTSINVSNNKLLTKLDCSRNKLTSLDIYNNTKLTWLACYDNELTELDIRTNWQLSVLGCQNNKISDLDVPQLPYLTVLICDNNNFSRLSLWNNANLTQLSCCHNNITELDTSHNSQLVALRCNYNQLTTLDVTNKAFLKVLYCDNNNITELDITNNKLLAEFNCSDNSLTELDVSNNIQLNKLYCDNNNLTSLDLTKNTALEFLHCNNNQLTILDVSRTNIGDAYSTYYDDVLECHMSSLETLILKTGWNLHTLITGGSEGDYYDNAKIQYVD